MASTWQALSNGVRGDIEGKTLANAAAEGSSPYKDTMFLRWSQDFNDLWANRCPLEELTVQTVSVVADTQEYALASDFSKILTVIGVNSDSTEYAIERFLPDADVDIRGTSDDTSDVVVGYYLYGVGDATQGSSVPKIGFLPSPTADQTVKVRYIRKPARPTALTDTCDFPQEWYPAIKEFFKAQVANVDQVPIKEQLHEARYLRYIRRARSYRAEQEEGYLVWRK